MVSSGMCLLGKLQYSLDNTATSAQCRRTKPLNCLWYKADQTGCANASVLENVKLWASLPTRLYRHLVSPPPHTHSAPCDPLLWSRAAATCLLHQQCRETLVNPCSHKHFKDSNTPAGEATKSSSEKCVNINAGTAMLPFTGSPL